MYVILLAGGLGTRISEETHRIPKPMIKIGGHPIIWHIIMNLKSQVDCPIYIAGGYKKESFFQLCETFQNSGVNVQLIDTGENTSTGGRVRRIMAQFPEDRALITYGDGLANVAINDLLAFHDSQQTIGTVTAVHPPARFGSLEVQGDSVSYFGEKVQAREGWINGGFIVVEKAFANYLVDDQTPLEGEPLASLARDGQLAAYKHNGFWKPMDTLREKNELEEIWKEGAAPWKIW